jgi:hypothetical protein
MLGNHSKLVIALWIRKSKSKSVLVEPRETMAHELFSYQILTTAKS